MDLTNMITTVDRHVLVDFLQVTIPKNNLIDQMGYDCGIVASNWATNIINIPFWGSGCR